MKSMIIAPHPDDEVLGAGGTFLRLKDEQAQTAWVIVSQISEDEGWSTEKIDLRNHTQVHLAYQEQKHPTCLNPKNRNQQTTH